MDPNAAYAELLLAIRRDDRVEAREYAEALQAWFARGGFRPAGVHPRDVHAAIASVLDSFGDKRDGVK